MLALIDKQKFKIKINMYLKQYLKNFILTLMVVLMCTILIASSSNRSGRYNNQFYYLYSIFLTMMLALGQTSILYGSIMKNFINFKFNRKEYYLENAILITIFSLIVTVMLFIGVAINMFLYKKSYLICMWFKFNNVNILTYVQAIVLMFFVINVSFMFVNLISVISITKNKIPFGLLSVTLALGMVYTLLAGDSILFSSSWIINHNTSYFLYLIAAFIVNILEYFIGREVFLRKDIVPGWLYEKKY
ncbi:MULTISPECIES: hypothetical protein [Clostridium]|uniref:hypothetical protein n=1 Tax=Clostridium TaxID=1485 RepID=UPI0008261EBA|nr:MULTISPECIES: hypothetical protein [Clostridium]PJI08556.1 hypothetical protein CUB90_12115 [Clostridium sp. CT7]